ncbi:MAG: polysaccharide deacetylase family protein [Leptospirillia bacterium]
MLVLLGSSPAFAEVPSHAVVLMYHRFGETTYPSTNIRTDQFKAHLDHLEQGGYRVWPLNRVVRHLKEGTALPDRVVAITIDDAYQSIRTVAYPILSARGWPFTVFVSTDAVDQGLAAYLSWEQMRDMRGHGVDFANHSASHDYLVRRNAGEDEAAWRARIAADIARATERITEELGPPPPLFAYPYGEYREALKDVVREAGLTGFGQHSGPIGPRSDFLALPRFPMSETYGGINDFRLKVATLPLPVTHHAPSDPMWEGGPPPQLSVTLAASDARLDELACYASGQGRIEVHWVDRDAGSFQVKAEKPLSKGRSRYNCTAPAGGSGRYYWFSQPWLRE